MRKLLLLALLPALTWPAFAQIPDYDGRGGGSSVRFPRMERGASSDRSSDRRDQSGDVVSVPYTPPDPLPGLVGDYRNLRGWFSGSNVFTDAPAFVEPANQTELYWALSALRDYADGKLRSLRSKRATLEARRRELQEQLRLDSDFSAELRREIATVEGDIARYDRETRGIEDQLSSQTLLLDQITDASKQVEAETKATRDGLFVRLREAEDSGVVLPPSSYRTLPSPPQPLYRRDNAAIAAQAARPALIVPTPWPISPAAPNAVTPFRAVAVAPLAAARAARRVTVDEQQVRGKMTEISELMPLLNAAIPALDAAYRSVYEQERLAAASSQAVEALRGQLGDLRSASDLRAGVLNETKAKLADADAAVQRLRERFPVQCLEWAVWEYYDEKVSEFIETKAAPQIADVLPAVNTDGLGKLTDVMSHVLELEQDTFKVIERVVSGVERPEDLLAELDEVVNRFNVNFFSDLTGVPEPLVKFFQKRKIP